MLGEVPPNRIEKLPVTLYRALQQQDMEQVRHLNRAQARMLALYAANREQESLCARRAADLCSKHLHRCSYQFTPLYLS